jgi:hypothetical protein
MIDLTSNIAAIEKIMKLMEKYKIDELSCDFLHLKKSVFSQPTTKRRKKEFAPLSDQELLDRQLQADHTDEPWNEVSETQLNDFSIKGKI